MVVNLRNETEFFVNSIGVPGTVLAVKDIKGLYASSIN